MNHLLARTQTHGPRLPTAINGCFPDMSDFLTIEQEKTGGIRKKEGRSKPREDETQAGHTSLMPDCLTETEKRGRGS